MKFGLFFQAPEADGHTHGERYAEVFDLIALAEDLGFDVAWLAELHFGGAFSLLAHPLMMVPGSRSAPGAFASGPRSRCCRSSIR